MMRPTPSSYSYLLRLPFGISTCARISSSKPWSAIAEQAIPDQCPPLDCAAMRRVAALLAAVALASALAACGDDGAEPGASREATLVLDFQPNAVHAGVYAALELGLFEVRGIELEIREPSASSDAPKLLAA